MDMMISEQANNPLIPALPYSLATIWDNLDSSKVLCLNLFFFGKFCPHWHLNLEHRTHPPNPLPLELVLGSYPILQADEESILAGMVFLM